LTLESTTEQLATPLTSQRTLEKRHDESENNTSDQERMGLFGKKSEKGTFKER